VTGSFGDAKRIFLEAVEREPQDRGAFVDDVCGGDDALRREVLALLAADAADDALEPAPPPGIAGFRIVRRIGEGGMGTVYEAEQESPRRRVALKVLATAFPDENAFRRFRYETEILGRLDHPHIARIYAAGGSGGRPYFAMELVEGGPLAAHARGLGLRARVDLLARVCDAVQHAHGRGVIHRDLKPANVLVDGEGNPKLLDFGVAKVLGDATQRRTLETRAGQLLGTLPYMSPEQLGAAPGAIDVRSDVYALGVIAFELVAGRRPMDLSGLSLHEAIVRLREREVPRLGTLDGRWRGDLETIVAKAVARDPAMRYESAGALAADLRRYLRDEPIQARPPSVGYQVRKFARRNRALVAAVLGILLSLVAGLVISVREYGRAEAARSEEQALKEVAERNEARAVRAEAAAQEEATRAREKAETAGQVSSLLVRIFKEADPTASRGESLTVREALGKGARLVAPGLEGQPAVRGDLEHAVGQVFFSLGLHDDATAHLAQALADRRATHAGDHEEVADTLMLLAEAHHFAHRYGQAEPLYLECLAMRRRLHGEEHEKTARTMDVLGRLRRERGDFAGARELHEAAMRIRAKVAGEESVAYVESLHSMAFLSHMSRDAPTARSYYERAIALRKRLNGEDDPELPQLLHGLGTLLSQGGEHAAAEAALLECVQRTRAVYGESHPFVAHGLNALAEELSLAGRVEDARARAREAMGFLPEEHPLYPTLVMTLGNIERDAHDYAAAVEAYARAERIYRERGEETSLVVALQNRGTTLSMLPGRGEEAEAAIRAAVALQSRLSGATARLTLYRRILQADVLRCIGKLDEAEAELKSLEPLVPPGSPLRPTLDTSARALVRARAAR
jgi:tetratricopeptide (TPR) repeat protein